MDVTAGKEMNLIDFFLCLAKKNYLSEKCAASAEYKVNVACKNNSALQ